VDGRGRGRGRGRGSGRQALVGAGPIVAAFATFGLFWGSWAVMLFNIQHAFKLSDSLTGVLLAVAVAVAGVSSAVMAHLADRVGARRLLWIALFSWCALLVILSVTQSRWEFAAALILVEIAGGSIDTAMNAEASHRLMGQPGALVRFHALFNTGALAGAALAGLIIHAGISFRWVWPGIAVAGGAVGVWALLTDSGTAMDGGVGGVGVGVGVAGGVVGGSSSGNVDTESNAPDHPYRRLRHEGLLVLLAVFALAEVTEGGVDTWGVLYLRNLHLTSGVLLGAGAYVIGQSVAATTRGAGGMLLGRLSARRGLIVGGCVAGGGILLESLSPHPLVAGIGLAMGTGGASLFWPLVMNAVSGQASRVVSAVGTFTAAGYIGWVAGAPVVGWVSQTYGAARGLEVLAVAAFGVAGCSLIRSERRIEPDETG
jgi:MFS family permease